MAMDHMEVGEEAAAMVVNNIFISSRLQFSDRLFMILGNGYGRSQGGSWNRMNHDNNSGWNNWNNDSYSDNSQWNNSPWDNGQSQSWGSGNFNQNWSNDSFGTGYQQNYGGGSQRGYSGNNRMVPYGNNQSEFVEFSTKGNGF
jgi:hypothetical protein